MGTLAFQVKKTSRDYGALSEKRAMGVIGGGRYFVLSHAVSIVIKEGVVLSNGGVLGPLNDDSYRGIGDESGLWCFFVYGWRGGVSFEELFESIQEGGK